MTNASTGANCPKVAGYWTSLTVSWSGCAWLKWFTMPCVTIMPLLIRVHGWRATLT